MSPKFRRAAHQALDLLLDAWAEEEEAKPKKRASANAKKLPMPDLPPERLAALKEQLDQQMGRGGYKKAG